ncbi:MAG: hypothetical protein DYG94_14270 [Leptolyngbya sp. PLA3]|nr:MAG: hypothetical protein EDM82_13280 [Cyanobacteria bacterium CYA]MCE7969893.1 hypothetical protein [Leptolyngbya sp. PL-A3]
MKVILDDQMLSESLKSVAGALEAGRQAAESRGRLVIEVHADGHPLASELLDNPPEHEAGIIELKMISTPPGPFIRTTLLDAVELLGPIEHDQAEAVGLLQTGQVEEALEPLQRALLAWSILRDLVEKSTQLGLTDPSRVVVQGGDWATARGGGEFIADLALHLGEVKRTLEIQDFTALADVLEGGLAADARSWEHFLRAMAEAAGGAA